MVSREQADLKITMEQLGIKVNKKELQMDPKPLLKVRCARRFFQVGELGVSASAPS